MDLETIKLVGGLLGFVVTALTLGEKLFGYGKRGYLFFKKITSGRFLSSFFKKGILARPTLLKKSDVSLAYARQTTPKKVQSVAMKATSCSDGTVQPVRKMSIWQMDETIKKLMQAYPIEQFLKNLKNNPFFKEGQVTGMQIGMMYACAVVFASGLFKNSSQLN